jgi:hypothetical protein
MKQANCNRKGCDNYGRYARYCGHIEGSLKPVKPIAPRSKKLDKIMKKEYVPQVKEMVEKGEVCKVQSRVCIGKTNGFHHIQGRIGAKLLGPKKVPCCGPCNRFIEANDLWARSNGWKQSKHEPNYTRPLKIDTG